MLPRGLSPEKTQETGGKWNEGRKQTWVGRENNKELISRVPTNIRFAFLMKRRETSPTDMTAHTCDDVNDDTKTYGMGRRIRQILNDPIKYRIEHAPLAATRVSSRFNPFGSFPFLPFCFLPGLGAPTAIKISITGEARSRDFARNSLSYIVFDGCPSYLCAQRAQKKEKERKKDGSVLSASYRPCRRRL